VFDAGRFHISNGEFYPPVCVILRMLKIKHYLNKRYKQGAHSEIIEAVKYI
jgi:hypothetical protein